MPQTQEERVGTLKYTLPVAVIVVLVLRSIFTGRATPTEATALGFPQIAIDKPGVRDNKAHSFTPSFPYTALTAGIEGKGFYRVSEVRSSALEIQSNFALE